MISGRKFYGVFTTVFTDVCEDVSFVVHCSPSGHNVPCSSKEVAEANKIYYERQGETATIEEKHSFIRCGEVQI